MGVFTVLTACTNSLSACSQTPIISGSDLRTQAAHVRVRPDGGVTVSYVNIAEGPVPDFLQLYDIKYVTCTPLGAPRHGIRVRLLRWDSDGTSRHLSRAES